MRTYHKQKSGFTMIELVIVIIVIGILAALALPRMDRDIRQEAADNILSAIRYTQHLALVDDKTNPFGGNWQQKLWAIRFTESTTNGGTYYTVASDSNANGGIPKNECAIDPANGKYMYHLNTNPTQSDESPNVVLGKKYGITTVTPGGIGCSYKHLAFDHLGRPFNGLKTSSSMTTAGNDYGTYMTADCNMTFSFAGGEDDLSIIIKKETGYAYIDGEPDS